jgi:membrane glycosyltransferase
MEDENTNSVKTSYGQRIFHQVRTIIFNVRQTFYDPPRPDLEQERLRLLASSAGHDESEIQAQKSGEPLTVMVFVKLFIMMAPLIATFTAFAPLIAAGLDPLMFSLLAMFLVLFGLVTIIIVRRYSSPPIYFPFPPVPLLSSANHG